jgi:hypothetical protein
MERALAAIEALTRIHPGATRETHRDEIEEAAQGVAERVSSLCGLGPHGERRDRQSDRCQHQRHPPRQHPRHVHPAEGHGPELAGAHNSATPTSATWRATCWAGLRPITRRSHPKHDLTGDGRVHLVVRRPRSP